MPGAGIDLTVGTADDLGGWLLDAVKANSTGVVLDFGGLSVGNAGAWICGCSLSGGANRSVVILIDNGVLTDDLARWILDCGRLRGLSWNVDSWSDSFYGLAVWHSSRASDAVRISDNCSCWSTITVGYTFPFWHRALVKHRNLVSWLVVDVVGGGGSGVARWFGLNETSDLSSYWMSDFCLGVKALAGVLRDDLNGLARWIHG